MRTIAGLLLILTAAAAQPVPVRMDEYIDAWKAAKAYTIAVAEAMPAESYTFKPTPDEFTFAAQMIHLSHANYYWFTAVLGEKRTIPDPKAEDKASVLAYVRDTFDYCIGALDRVTPAQLSQTAPGVGGRKSGSGRDALLNMYMHVAHHRGQAIVYLRLKGVKPPEYLY
ncbi:MAG: DinB family protein [Bryobacteraceae bacterium]